MLAMAAVMLSVATILITWSVMGGFLKTLIESGKTLVGDVAIVWPNVGFAHYDDLIERLEADELIDSASPTIETFGLIELPDGRIELISIQGDANATTARRQAVQDVLDGEGVDR